MLKRLFAIVPMLAAILLSSQALPASAIVRDGHTIQLGDIAYKLDGIDAPEFDQTCIDDHADAWTCGIDARDQLTKLINGRNVRCDDLGLDKTKKRHPGACPVEGERASLHPQLAKLRL